MRIFVVIYTKISLFPLSPRPVVYHFSLTILKVRQFTDPMKKSSQKITQVRHTFEVSDCRKDIQTHTVHNSIFPLSHIPISIGKYVYPKIIFNCSVGASYFAGVILILTLESVHWILTHLYIYLSWKEKFPLIRCNSASVGWTVQVGWVDLSYRPVWELRGVRVGGDRCADLNWFCSCVKSIYSDEYISMWVLGDMIRWDFSILLICM